MNPAVTSKGITIIIPVYNEEKRIKDSIERLLSYGIQNAWDFELIFVDDGSTDNTCSIITNFSLSDSRIKLLTIPRRVGKGGSIICTVLSIPTKDYVAYMDADLAAGPSELNKLLNYIEDFDVVIGSRILRGDLMPIKRPFYRTFLSHLYSKIFRILFRAPILDPQCGLKLFKREIVLTLFKEVKVTGFAFDTDLLITALSQGIKIKEIPINWTHYENSKLSVIKEVVSMGLDLLSIWYLYHTSWQHGNKTYPQKKGTILGRIFYSLLSSSQIITKRHLGYPMVLPVETNLNQKNIRV